MNGTRQQISNNLTITNVNVFVRFTQPHVARLPCKKYKQN